MFEDYKRVTKDGVKPIVEIAHQRIGGIHLRFYTKDGYHKFDAVWDGDTLWIKQGSLQVDISHIPKVKFDEYS